MPTQKRSKLYVEGKDDFHVVMHLLMRYGIFLHGNEHALPNAPELEMARGVEKVLGDNNDELPCKIKTAIQVNRGLSVGFVLDADDRPQARWRAVRDRLQECELDVPAEMPANGYVDDVAKYKMRVGIWLMPGHQREGAVEQFLMDLVPQDDTLLNLAESSTDEALGRGATFPNAKRSKAVLHAWLAWQKHPGQPYGSAINERFFGHDSTAARDFVAWYQRVFP